MTNRTWQFNLSIDFGSQLIERHTIRGTYSEPGFFHLAPLFSVQLNNLAPIEQRPWTMDAMVNDITKVDEEHREAVQMIQSLFGSERMVAVLPCSVEGPGILAYTVFGQSSLFGSADRFALAMGIETESGIVEQIVGVATNDNPIIKQTINIGRLNSAHARELARGPGFGGTSSEPRVVDAVTEQQLIIECTHCSTRNRVPISTISSALCGHCRGRLAG